MSEAWNRGEDARRASASDWLVRLQAPDLANLDEQVAEAVAFDGWLSAHAANAQAYDDVLAATLELQAAAPAIGQMSANDSKLVATESAASNRIRIRSIGDATSPRHAMSNRSRQFFR